MLRDERTAWAGAGKEGQANAVRGCGEVNHKEIVFLYERSRQVIENKGQRVQNEPNFERKIGANSTRKWSKITVFTHFSTHSDPGRVEGKGG
jgi:hypothetical protein